MVLGFMRRLSLLPEGSLYLDNLRDTTADARQPLICPTGLRVLASSSGTWVWALLSFSLGLGLWTAMVS